MENLNLFFNSFILLKNEEIKGFFCENLENGTILQYLPELADLWRVPTRHPFHIHDTAGAHTLAVIEATDPVKLPLLRVAALFHDLGKTKTWFWGEDGFTHFRGHEAVSAAMSKTLLEGVKIFTPSEKETIVKIVFLHGVNLYPKLEELSKFVADNKLTQEQLTLLIALKRADLLGQNPEKANSWLNLLDEVENFVEQNKANLW